MHTVPLERVGGLGDGSECQNIGSGQWNDGTELRAPGSLGPAGGIQINTERCLGSRTSAPSLPLSLRPARYYYYLEFSSC
ncbi:hypothetical protein RSAG8_00592, partial [Rhizoctonia solani AG-8 WAC10335]